MSTLTKVLIILLTVLSIFLCGIVVTYVANAVNYKQRYETLRTDLQAARRKAEDADSRLNKTIKQTDLQKTELNNQIASLKVKIEQLEGMLRAAERDKAQQLQRLDGLAAQVAEFIKTNEHQGTVLEDTINKWERAESARIKEQSDHEETARVLLEKMAIIATLEEKNKQLLEQATELQAKLDQILRQYGKILVPPTTVTPTKAKARPAPPTEAIGLKGTVTAVGGPRIRL